MIAVFGSTWLTTLKECGGRQSISVAFDVWEKIRVRSPHQKIEGTVLSGRAYWQPMTDTWASRFPSTRDVPRGYLVIDNPDAINVHDDISATQIHPFTVMEYRSGAKELFDFVYAGADTLRPNYRDQLERFFERYKNEQERYGRYLLAGDMMTPLWDAQFNSPAELSRDDPSAESHLALLEARVRERLLGRETIEVLLEALGVTSTQHADLRRLSEDIGIKPALWYRHRSIAESCSHFLAEVVRQGQEKLEELIEVLTPQYQLRTPA